MQLTSRGCRERPTRTSKILSCSIIADAEYRGKLSQGYGGTHPNDHFVSKLSLLTADPPFASAKNPLLCPSLGATPPPPSVASTSSAPEASSSGEYSFHMVGAPTCALGRNLSGAGVSTQIQGSEGMRRAVALGTSLDDVRGTSSRASSTSSVGRRYHSLSATARRVHSDCDNFMSEVEQQAAHILEGATSSTSTVALWNGGGGQHFHRFVYSVPCPPASQMPWENPTFLAPIAAPLASSSIRPRERRASSKDRRVFSIDGCGSRVGQDTALSARDCSLSARSLRGSWHGATSSFSCPPPLSDGCAGFRTCSGDVPHATAARASRRGSRSISASRGVVGVETCIASGEAPSFSEQQRLEQQRSAPNLRPRERKEALSTSAHERFERRVSAPTLRTREHNKAASPLGHTDPQRVTPPASVVAALPSREAIPKLDAATSPIAYPSVAAADEEFEEPLESMVDVFLRIRPPESREHGELQAVRCVEHWVHVDDPARVDEGYWFHFDGVVDSSRGRRVASVSGASSSRGRLEPEQPGAVGSQEEVFGLVGAKVVASALDGFHSCVFSLGQTGTGKTYTLIGTSEAPGLLPRMLRRLLSASTTSADPRRRGSLRLSCMELHMDKLRDLLADGSAGDRPAPEIRSVPGHGVYVSNLCEVSVEDDQAALQLVQVASRNRFTAHTGMNAASSRGHAVFQLTLESGARLCVVDLAGRENERTTRCRGQTLAELGYINKSLFHLTNVISALSRPKANSQNLVPFRNSKLTLLLSECLQSSRASLLATISPAASSLDETLSTLRLAQAVRQISTRSRRGSCARSSRGSARGGGSRNSPYPSGSLGSSRHATPRHLYATPRSPQQAPQLPQHFLIATPTSASPSALSPAHQRVPTPTPTAPSSRRTSFRGDVVAFAASTPERSPSPRIEPPTEAIAVGPSPEGVPLPRAFGLGLAPSRPQVQRGCGAPSADFEDAKTDADDEVSGVAQRREATTDDHCFDDFTRRRLAAWKSSAASSSSRTTAASQKSKRSQHVPATDSERERLSTAEEDPDAHEDVDEEHFFVQVIEAPRLTFR